MFNSLKVDSGKISNYKVTGVGANNIKDIQRGIYTLNTANVATINISKVNLNNSIIRISPYSTAAPESFFLRGALASETTFTLDRGKRDTTVAYCYWEVIEFNNVKSLQSGVITKSSTSKNVSISEVDPDKSQLFFSWSTISTSSNVNYEVIAGGIISPTSIQFQTGFYSNVQLIQWYLVEFY